MNSAYAIRSPLFLTNRSFGTSFVHDASLEEREHRLDFHVESGDYFATLATIMVLIADALSSDHPGARDRSIKTLYELREDLCYLQDKYVIDRK